MPRLTTRSIGLRRATLLALSGSCFNSHTPGDAYDRLQRLNFCRSDGRRASRATILLLPDDRSGICLLSCRTAADGRDASGVNHFEVLSRPALARRRVRGPHAVRPATRPGFALAELDLAPAGAT